MELSIILGLFAILILALNSKNKRISKLEENENHLRKGINMMSQIIRESNVTGKLPKDLENE